MEDKKINMTEHQWRIFEYNMSKWMIENKYILDKDEKKKFYKCANYSIGTGMINGSLVYLFCKRNKNYFSPISRFFLTFSVGVYTSMVVNKIFRRKAYTEILTGKTTMTNKAKEVMIDVLNINDNKKLPPNEVDKIGKSTSTLSRSEYISLGDGDIQPNNDSNWKDDTNVSVFPDLNEAITNEQENELDRCKDVSVCADENIKNMIKALEKYS
ncbi:conserved Plasmodium protein, unknown function [Plasmodium ovale wallikeri]|uniref:Uncharacterized protein n=1 Tax=Plasmodium ovale wallikeri TaxID=864142 RepID=A0A1A8YHL6_PLAOA|nr:conserved Plasmodium protein, unknown function [Plasmodium ovale wallikeri]SBT44426.1 conserved Plasmodium protein, unknown function [Plasmodium ovale wallikeri]